MEVVDTMALTTELEGTEKDGTLLCEGELETGSYTLTLTEDGVPVSFSLPSYGVVITFDSFTEQTNASPTEETTIERTFPVEDVESSSEE